MKQLGPTKTSKLAMGRIHWRTTVLLLAMLILSIPIAKHRLSAQSSELSDKVLKIQILQQLSHRSLDALREGFLSELEAAGYHEGENLQVDYKSAENDLSAAQSIAHVFREQEADCVLTIGTAASQAVVRQISDRPVFFAAVSDPVSAQLLKNAEAPEALVTGTSDRVDAMSEVRAMRQFYPDLKRVGLIYSSGEINSSSQVELVSTVLDELGIEHKSYGIASSDELAAHLEVAFQENDLIYIPTDNSIASAMALVHKYELKYDKPIYVSSRSMLEEAGLFSLGFNYESLGRLNAKMLLEYLDGKAISELPVSYAVQDQLYYSEARLKELGLELPADLLEDAASLESLELDEERK
ncbi:MAG: ABC transporter substrate-binding protein [Eubacteriales bacterium]|nr:ABC transporter substrate-binding protein [Eubacteriales bacterium]